MKRYVSTEGSDLNPGTKRRPFRTVGRAIRVLEAYRTLYPKKKGHTILYITAGTYREEVKQVLLKGERR